MRERITLNTPDGAITMPIYPNKETYLSEKNALEDNIEFYRVVSHVHDPQGQPYAVYYDFENYVYFAVKH